MKASAMRVRGYGSVLSAAALCSLAAPPLHAQVVLRVRPEASANGDGSSWETAFQHLQPALEAAAPVAASGEHVEIWLARGSYAPTHRPDPAEPASATFHLLDRVAIYGGFAGGEDDRADREPRINETTLTGQLAAWHVVTAKDVGESAILDGVIIADGRPGFGDPPGSDRGGGIYGVRASPTIVGCVIQNNLAVLLGANGAGAAFDSGSPRFVGCTFIANGADAGDGGAFASQDAAPRLDDCIFMGNSAGFGGGAIAGSGFCAERCTFVANTSKGGGALYGSGRFRSCTFSLNVGGSSGGAAFGVRDSTFIDCRFQENLGGFDGGGIASAANSAFLGCSFVRNMTSGLGSGASGGGLFANCLFNANTGGPTLFVSGSAPRVANCTFFGNDGGGIGYAGPGIVFVRNTVLWMNHVNGVADESAQISINVGAVEVRHSFVQGLGPLYSGGGNLGGPTSPDPALADPLGADGIAGTDDDDLRLARGSVCIDAASNLWLPPDTDDVDGDGDTDEPLPIDGAGADRRLDDPCTIDAGDGGAPVVDMGAFEFLPEIGNPDVNEDGGIDSRDFFAFLTAFFAGDGDFNEDGATTPEDFFDFLRAFFLECP